MCSAVYARFPNVSVVHHEVGPDRSVSIEQFLRSLKRDPSKFSSSRRAQKPRRSYSSGDQQQLAPPHAPETSIPVLDDDESAAWLAQDSTAEAPHERHQYGTNPAIESRIKVQSPEYTRVRPRVKKVYGRKHKNQIPAILPADLIPRTSLRSNREGPTSEARPVGMSSDYSWHIRTEFPKRQQDAP